MKKKQILGVTAGMAVLMAASLTGCSFKATPESISKKVISHMASVKSAAGNMTVEFNGNISIPDYDQEMDMEMTMDMDFEMTTDPIVSHETGSLDMTAAGQSMSYKTEVYSQVDDDQMLTYTSEDDGDTWTKTTTDMDDDELENAGAVFNEQLFKNIQDGEYDTELAEDTEKVNDADCYVLSFTCSGDQIRDIMTVSSMEDMFEGIDDKDLEDTDVDISIYVDKKTWEPLKYTMDMADLGALFIESSMGLTGSDIDVDTDIDTFTYEETIDEYNGVDEIEIPKEALKAEESTDSGLFSGMEEETETETDTNTSGSSGTSDAGDSPLADVIANAPESGSADWSTLSLKIDSKDYQVPFNYADVSGDWAIDESQYPAGYVTNPSDEHFVSVKNPNYNDSYFYTAFIMANTSDGTQDITQNSVVGLTLDTSNATSYPSVELPGGITWGSSLEDVLNAYGKPSTDPYYASSLGYYDLSYYDASYDKVLDLIVYVDGGLKEITIETF